MDKVILKDKIKQMGHLPQSDRDKLTAWVDSLPNSLSKLKPSDFRIGDVFMHPIFHHPYVLLRKRKDHWICTMFTTEPNCEEILEPCMSRFYENNFITKILFTVKEPVGAFMSTYENKQHLDKVYKNLKQFLL